MQIFAALRTISTGDIALRAFVACIIALALIATGNLPTSFVVSVVFAAVVMSIVMLVVWRAVRR